MNERISSVDSDPAEFMNSLEALYELDASLKEVAKQFTRLNNLPAELTGAWQSLLRARDTLEDSIRHT